MATATSSDDVASTAISVRHYTVLWTISARRFLVIFISKKVQTDFVECSKCVALGVLHNRLDCGNSRLSMQMGRVLVASTQCGRLVNDDKSQIT